MPLLPFTSAMTYAQVLDRSSAGPAILASNVSEMSDHSGASLQEIKPSPEGHGRTVSMGEFVRDVFLEQVSVVAINLPARSAFQCQLFRVMHVHAPSYAAKVVSKPSQGNISSWALTVCLSYAGPACFQSRALTCLGCMAALLWVLGAPSAHLCSALRAYAYKVLSVAFVWCAVHHSASAFPANSMMACMQIPQGWQLTCKLCGCMQYYFETIFPRIPKLVQDQFETKLTTMGLPSKAVGNAGQGGPDRRGIEEANRRPASVKASL